jgi:trk system potassium uptake protein TrkA
MKIIICGAGQSGKNIAKYLLKDNNDIVVIDNDVEKLEKIASELDIQPIEGHSSHPHILKKAGADSADVLIAVTHSDEINMVACQVAHTLFNVPKKIARIGSQDYLQPLWAELYNKENMPIDFIISPEIKIANSIIRRLEIPGALDVLPLANNKVKLIGFKCSDNYPILSIPIMQIQRLYPDLRLVVLGIKRNGNFLFANKKLEILENDEVYFIVDNEQVDVAIEAFGKQDFRNDKILIFGGSSISSFLAQKIEELEHVQSCNMIINNLEKAEKFASLLNRTNVIHGEYSELSILEEAGIDNTDIAIAVTRDDETNLLSSLVSKKHGVKNTISMVNTSIYNNLLDNLGVDVVMDKGSITVSSILREIRKGKINFAYSLGNNSGEIIEADAMPTSDIVGKTIKDLKLPDEINIAAIIRSDEVIYPENSTEFFARDKVILFAADKHIKKIEELFSVGIDYF